MANCSGGSPQACVAGTPGTEVCGGGDEDCDGTIDEGLGQTTCGTGDCERTVDNCFGGTPQVCVPGSPSSEICNGFDDDCDGSTDENATSEICNRVDDDCNGLTDEGITCPYYRTDVLESGNPGGWGTSLKTFDDSIAVLPGTTFSIDVWLNADSVLLPSVPDAGGVSLDFTTDTAGLTITNILRYDGELAGPWLAGGIDVIGPSGGVLNGQAEVTVVNAGGAARDAADEIIIANIEFVSGNIGPVPVDFLTIPGFGTWSWIPVIPWDDSMIPVNTFTVNNHMCRRFSTRASLGVLLPNTTGGPPGKT